MNKRDGLGIINIQMDMIKNFSKARKKGIYSFEYDNKKYYLKEFKNTSYLYNEMIAYEIGKCFGLDMVSYDIAFIDDYIGYLSVDYMKKGYFYLEDLLKSFYSTFVNKNNLNDVCFMFLSIYGDEVSKKITDELIKLMMFDIIIANSDRHDRNIIIDMNNYKLGPVSDNEMMLEDMALYYNYYGFGVSNNTNNILEEFLNILDDNQLKYFKDMIELISDKNIQVVIEKVQTKIGAPMIDSIKNSIINRFRDNYRILSKLVDSKINERGMTKSLWK